MGQNWNKAHDPSKNTHWINYPSIDSPIIDDELNRNEVSVDTIDDRVITLDTTKAEQSDLLLAFKDVSLNTSTGVITFTLFNNTTKTIDTLLEKIAINFDYDDDPTSAHYQNLVITLEDGTVKYIDMSALITQYEFVNSSTIAWTIGNNGSVSASVPDGSITESKLQPNFLADCRAAKTGAENAEADAIAKALVSEGYANGKQNGVPVTSESPYYHNNAEYFKDQAQSIVGSKVDSFNGRTGVVTSQSGDYNQSQIGVPTGATEGQVPVVRSGVFVMEAQSKGLLPHITITSETGSTVTATKGVKTYTATETSTGTFEVDVEEYGTYTISSELNGDTETRTITIDDVKCYTIEVMHFEATITVTFPSGGTCSCSKSGETTLYADTNPYTFTVHKSGTWTITIGANNETYTENVSVTTSGQSESLTVPIGSTVTPTDSVATLLSCALINDTNITTIADLLADSTTLLAVISSNNAIDYLARSTTFASSITADSSAMTDIGANNYASDTLLSDITWRTAIVQSTYRENILNYKAPTMTSNTTPSGIASASSQLGNYYPYLALTDTPSGDGRTQWYPNAQGSSTVGQWWQYAFSKNIKVYGIYVHWATSNSVVGTWEVSYGGYSKTISTNQSYTALDDIEKLNTFKITCKTASGSGYFGLNRVQFYAREDV